MGIVINYVDVLIHLHCVYKTMVAFALKDGHLSAMVTYSLRTREVPGSISGGVTVIQKALPCHHMSPFVM